MLTIYWNGTTLGIAQPAICCLLQATPVAELKEQSVGIFARGNHVGPQMIGRKVDWLSNAAAKEQSNSVLLSLLILEIPNQRGNLRQKRRWNVNNLLCVWKIISKSRKFGSAYWCRLQTPFFSISEGFANTLTIIIAVILIIRNHCSRVILCSASFVNFVGRSS